MNGGTLSRSVHIDRSREGTLALSSLFLPTQDFGRDWHRSSGPLESKMMRVLIAIVSLFGVSANLMALLPAAHADTYCGQNPTSEDNAAPCCARDAANNDKEGHPSKDDACRECSFCKIAPAGPMVVLPTSCAIIHSVLTQTLIIGCTVPAAGSLVPPVPPPRSNAM